MVQVKLFISEIFLNNSKVNYIFVIQVPGSQTSGKVDGLPEGSEYQFRVVAVNKAGPSEASEPTKMTTIRHKSRKFIYFYTLTG